MIFGWGVLLFVFDVVEYLMGRDDIVLNSSPRDEGRLLLGNEGWHDGFQAFSQDLKREFCIETCINLWAETGEHTEDDRLWEQE